MGFQGIRRKTGKLTYEMEGRSEAVRVLGKKEMNRKGSTLGAYTSKTFWNKGLPCVVCGCSDRNKRDMNIHAL